MGNESSFLSGLRVDYEKAIEVNELWTHYSATYTKGDNVQNISLFTTDRESNFNDDLDPVSCSSKVSNFKVIFHISYLINSNHLESFITSLMITKYKLAVLLPNKIQRNHFKNPQ